MKKQEELCPRNRADLQNLAAHSSHWQLIVYHLVMEVGEKQRWSEAIFVTLFLSVWQGLQVHHCNWMAPLATSSSAHIHTHTQRDKYTLHIETCELTQTHTHTHSTDAPSSDNHPVGETEGRYWLTGLVFLLTRTANHFTHNSQSSAGTLIQISSALPQTHNNSLDIKSVWKRGSYSTRGLGKNQWGSNAVKCDTVCVSTVPEANFWKKVFSFLNTNEMAKTRFNNNVHLAVWLTQELLLLDN